MKKLTTQQTDRLNATLAKIGEILTQKIIDKNSLPVSLQVDMNCGGFRSLQETKRTTIKTVSL